MTTSQMQIRRITRGIYDLQKLRIQAGNRLIAHYLVKLGIQPGQEKTADVEHLFSLLKSEYKTLTDGLVNKKGIPKKFISNGLISDEVEFALVNAYEKLVEEEAFQTVILTMALKEFPIYTEFLSQIRGIGPLMAGVIISEIDITRATYVSSLWKYAGLDVVVLEDGTALGRSRRRECLVPKVYTNSDGETVETVGITYNPFLKTKLLGVLATSFLRSKSPYADYYYQYKNRLMNHPKHKEKSKNHIHRMAIRYMIKMFLRDLYMAWRTLEGLPTYPTYEQEKLGIVHKKAAM